jgi:hypothetical protein
LTDQEPKEESKEQTPEEKIAELEDKVARTFAEMENQRRRFEKEKEEAASLNLFFATPTPAVRYGVKPLKSECHNMHLFQELCY